MCHRKDHGMCHRKDHDMCHRKDHGMCHRKDHDMCHCKDHGKFHENRSSGLRVGVQTDRQGWPSHKPACASCSFPKDDGEYLPLHGMNECNGVEFYLHAFLTTALDGDE
jgi:hypothetical protein